MKRALLIIAIGISGCASNSGVLDTGAGTFYLTRQGATGFSNLETIKVEAIHEATAYCHQRNLNFKLASLASSSGPYVFGNFPHVDLQFSCLPS